MILEFLSYKYFINSILLMGKNSIIFTGHASSGKSTAAQTTAKAFGLKFYDGGDILKLLAKDMGYSPEGKDWWDTKEGMEFFALRKKDSSFDKKVDEKFIEILDKGNCAITSWTMAWLYKGEALRIWMSATLQERANRMAVRDKIHSSDAKEIVKERDHINEELYKKLYGIKFGQDFKPFDILMDTTKMTQKEVSENLIHDLKRILKKIPKSTSSSPNL